MDGENSGKPPIKMDDLGGTTIFGNIQMALFFGGLVFVTLKFSKEGDPPPCSEESPVR